MGGDRRKRGAIASSGDSTSQLCFFSLPCSLLTPFQLLLYPARLTTSLFSPSPRFRSWLLSLSLDSAGLLFSKTISPFLYGLSLSLPSFLPPSLLPPRSFNLRFEDYKSFTSPAPSLPLSLARAIFSISPLTFVPPPHAANPLLLAPPRWERMG